MPLACILEHVDDTRGAGYPLPEMLFVILFLF